MTGFDFSNRSGYPCWSASDGELEMRFIGRGRHVARDGVLRAIEPDHDLAPVSWARQIHSARRLPARPGLVGEGDALYTESRGLPLCVATADCVPIVLAADGRIAAVHAGWRGLAAELPRIAAAELGRTNSSISAWIGPAIGRCCYEVGAEVADAVAGVSDATVVDRRPPRPHLDLVAAARAQLTAGGVSRVQAVDSCTRCNADLLWSYRREGTNAGRNLAFVWRR